ncbi:MAG: hypothetical protein ACI4XJ_09290, partial [Eubacteriales bacterium]
MSEIAPIDLILQRSGRLHRHSDTKRPETLRKARLTIIVPENDNYGASGLIYYKLLLDRTALLLKKRGSIQIPGDIPQLVNEVYQKNIISDAEAERFFEMQFKDEFKAGQAGIAELSTPQRTNFGLAEAESGIFGDDENSWAAAKTRLGEDTAKIAIIPQKLYDEISALIEKDELIPSELAKKVMLYSITVRQNSVKQLEGYGLNGKGKLFGVKMFMAEDENVLPTETAVSCAGSTVMIADKEIGFIIKKEGERDV